MAVVTIKKIPEDFVVNEIPNTHPQDHGDYCYFWMKKIDYTTLDAARRVARALGVKKVTFAGSKDKKAITRQLCSAYRTKKEKIERVRLKDIELEFFGYGEQPISLGDLKGNEFVIVLRDVGEEGLQRFKSNIKKAIEVVNYFDEQRFSEHNVDIGRAIVTRNFKKAVDILCTGRGDYNVKVTDYIAKNKGNYVGALQILPKKVLTLFVHAYQSWLWNETVKELVGEGMEIKYSQGVFVFPMKKVKKMKVPLLGFGTEVKPKKMKEIITRLLQKEKITLREFIVRELPDASMDGSERDMVVDVKEFHYEIYENNVKLSFFLPKGSYATIVVKKLFEAE